MPPRKSKSPSLFDRWNASLQTGDPKKVVANYASKSILLPTVSNKPRLTAEEKEDYFEHFLQGKPVGTIDSRHHRDRLQQRHRRRLVHVQVRGRLSGEPAFIL